MYYVTEVLDNAAIIKNEGKFTFSELSLLRPLQIEGVKYLKSGVRVSVYKGFDIGDLYIDSVVGDKCTVVNALNGARKSLRLSEVEEWVRSGRRILGVEMLESGMVRFESHVPPIQATVKGAKELLLGQRWANVNPAGQLLSTHLEENKKYVFGDVCTELMKHCVHLYRCPVTFEFDDRVKKVHPLWLDEQSDGSGGRVILSDYTNLAIAQDIAYRARKAGVIVVDAERSAYYNIYYNCLSYNFYDDRIPVSTDTLLVQTNWKRMLKELKQIASAKKEFKVPRFSKPEFEVFVAGLHDSDYESICMVRDVIVSAKKYFNKKPYLTLGYVLQGGRDARIRAFWEGFFDESLRRS